MRRTALPMVLALLLTSAPAFAFDCHQVGQNVIDSEGRHGTIKEAYCEHASISYLVEYPDGSTQPFAWHAAIGALVNDELPRAID